MFGIPCGCGGFALRGEMIAKPLKVLLGKDSLVSESAGWLGHKLRGEDVVDPVRFHVQDRGDVLQGK